MRTNRVLLLASVLAATNCLAYDAITHDRITANAISASELEKHIQVLGIANTNAQLPSTTFMTSFGVFNAAFHIPFDYDLTTTPRCIDQGSSYGISIKSLFRLGVYCEDGTDVALHGLVLRYANHFFDPTHGGIGIYPGASSLAWGTESDGSFSSQDFSYLDFKEYVADGVTSKSVRSRQRSMANAFRALGQVMHLVEDLAQPQHTRADVHGIPDSFYERYTDEVSQMLPMTGYSPSVLAGASISDIWHTADGKGLADYSNRGFVTKKTNFQGTANGIRANVQYDLPSGDGAVLHSMQIQDLARSAQCPGPEIPRSLIGDLTFIETPVVDRATNTTDINPRTSTYSLFDEDLKNYGFSKTFTLNRFNFCEAQKLLIPRAVGYAAALVNYAFRGGLEISLLDDSVAAIANGGDLDCKVLCGFGLIKAKVRNATPGKEEIRAGRLVAVARYHRNACFHPDLSGQPSGPNFVGTTCRTPASLEPLNEYVSVSKEFKVDSMSAVEPSVLSFDFSDNPIPLDATDIYLQVMFRGQLGQEVDGIALGSIDLAEPTFFTFSNDYDYINVYAADGEYMGSPPTAPGVSRRVEHFTFRHYVKSGDSSVLASFDLLSPGLFARIAILTDAPHFSYQIDYRYGGSDPEDVKSQAFDIDTARMQLNESNVWQLSPYYVTLRRYSFSGWLYQPITDGASIYWLEDPVCAEGHPECVPVDKTVGERVRRFPQFSQPNPLPMKIDFNERS